MRIDVSSRAWVLRLLAMAGLAATRALPAQELPQVDGAALLSSGDSVRITVWRRPELSGEFVVAPDGSVTHPLYRAVKVGGVPLAAAEENVRVFLTRFEDNPQFVVEPLLRVALEGEVNRPNLYAMRPQTTIAEALARAGGPTQYGRTDRVLVLRADGSGQHQQITVDLAHPETGATRMPIRSGDQITVERRRSAFRDVILPALNVVGSVAAVGLLIVRATGK
jgi:protein involved in polysaccharide export with SLBB domain